MEDKTRRINYFQPYNLKVLKINDKNYPFLQYIAVEY